MKRFVAGALVGAGLMHMCDTQDAKRAESDKIAAREAQERLGDAIGENRRLTCLAVGLGWPLDLVPHHSDFVESYGPVVGRNAARQPHFKDLPFSDAYGMPGECASGLSREAVVDMCDEIGFKVTAAQVSASVNKSGDDTQSKLSCLK